MVVTGSASETSPAALERQRDDQEALRLSMPGSALMHGARSAEPGLFHYWEIVWASRWLIVIVASIMAVASVVYAFTVRPVYRAEVLLARVQEDEMQGALLGQLGGLAGLAGIRLDQGSGPEALAVLESRKFTREFITENNLLPALYADEWDEVRQEWRPRDGNASPDMREAVRYFGKAVRFVREDKATGLVTLAVEWFDPAVSAKWANSLAQRLNAVLRARALAEAEENIEYLRSQVNEISNLTLQQAAANLLEREMQKLMMARGNQEFAFRIVDPAETPDKRSWPMRSLIVASATFAGIFLAIVFALVRGEIRRYRAAVQML